MKQTTIEAIRAHAESTFPRECCGLVYVDKGKEKYNPCGNLASDADHFILDPQDFAATEDLGEITHVVHSHCYVSPLPSPADLTNCEKTGLRWFIYSLPTHQTYEFSPSGYAASLIGREFSHGVLDCYALVRDYYQTIGISLPDYARENEWWLKGKNLYLDQFKEAGFVVVPADTLREHDGLLMQVASPTPNHAAVYTGGGVVLQHFAGRLSSRDVYGGWFEKITTHTLRHQSLC